VLIAIADPASERNLFVLFAIEVPDLGSFIASGKWTAREVGREAYPRNDRPPVIIPFFGFRAMVGMGLVMLAVSWFGTCCTFATGQRRHAGFLGAPFCLFHWGSSPFLPDGTRPKSVASLGSLWSAPHFRRGHAVTDNG
jgi:cytochrome bd ubiquinol oxidase subunit I